MSKITPDELWRAHRAAAGGKSTITGAPLPASLDDLQVGPTETHYAMCVFAAIVYNDPEPVPVPEKTSSGGLLRASRLTSGLS